MATRILPSGTVTFLFTDVEGSTKLLHELGADAYAAALADHRRLLREAFTTHSGVEVDTQGDAFFVAFPSAAGAVSAARQATETLAGGPIRVRIGLHTGTPLLTDEGYVGADVHRAARIAAAGHGGQVLVSAETRELSDGPFLDLGEHRLKDFASPVWIYQLGNDAFPPLTTISNTNLPNPATTLVGRERESTEVIDRIRGGNRLLTLTGTGGTGKTRLAIEAARQLVGEFRSGVFWVEAAPYREPGLVIQAAELSIGARGSLAEHIGERELLLLIDNLEQVLSVGPELATLVERCPNLFLLLTSRERLRVRGEVEYAVAPLADPEAIALYAARADIEPDDDVARLCAALDKLPLAIELAASRSGVLSPAQTLERLSGRLDLLRGGRDADPRQRTLRATIDWSHELLEPSEQRLFARLSVFPGGADLGAAEAVADADLDDLQSLVDKSLVRHTDARFWMLESIRGYAVERLAGSGELDRVRRRHADHYLALAERELAVLDAGEPEEGPVEVLERDIDNIRAAVDFGLEVGDHDLVRRITNALPMYWIMRGLHREARAWLERAIGLDDAHDQLSRRLQSALAIIAYSMGDHAVAVEAADTAAVLAAELAGTGARSASLRDDALAALMRGDDATAERLFLERLEVVKAAGNGVGTSSCRINLAAIANRTRRYDRARELLEENLPFVRARGQSRCEATTLSGLADTAIRDRRPDDGVDDALLAARIAIEIRDPPLALFSLDTIAASAAAHEDARAATLLGGTEAARRRLDFEPDPDEQPVRDQALEALGPDTAVYREAWAQGASMELPALLDMATAVAADLRGSTAEALARR